MISKFNRLPAFLAAGVLAIGLMSSAGAQTDNAAAPAAPAAQPDAAAIARAETTGSDKMVGDWNVRCFNVQSAAPCDIFQMLVNKKLRVRVMSVSVAYAPSSARYLIQITVPLEVALAKGVQVQAGTYTSPKMIYRRCANDGCIVEGPVDASIITALTQAGGAAKVLVVTRDGRSIGLPMSLNGFGDALTAMKAQAAEKAIKK